MPRRPPNPNDHLLRPSSSSIIRLVKSVANLDEPPNPPYLLHLFRQIPTPTTFLWNIVIRALFRGSSPLDSLRLYDQMRKRSVSPDAHTFKYSFKACGAGSLIKEGKSIHSDCVRRFAETDALIANSLMQMYVEFGEIGDARRVFDSIVTKDVVSWTTILNGCLKSGAVDEAVKVFDAMPERNVVSWTIMVSGFAKIGLSGEAIGFFKRMVEEGVKPDEVSIVSVLSACARSKDLETGEWVHRLCGNKGELTAVALVDMYAKCGNMESARRVFESADRRVTPAWNALIDGYCKSGDLESAQSLFDRMDHQRRDVVTFNSMITGYIHGGRFKEALRFFKEVQRLGLRPDNFTIVGFLTACTSLGALDQGRALHAYIVTSPIKNDVYIETALLDMYAKCGHIDHATAVFARMQCKDRQAFTAMISGLAVHGEGESALTHFDSMIEQGIRPNGVAYIAVLSACSHSNLVEEGRKRFKEMKSIHHIEPEIEHYGCMVDLLGRGGRLKEAEDLIQTMPIEPNSVIWASLLNACRVYNDVELAEKAAKKLIELEPDEDGAYVLMRNVYTRARRRAEAANVRRLMEAKGVRKMKGWSSIVVDGAVHEFVSGEASHPEMERIRAKMEEVEGRLRSEGYVAEGAGEVWMDVTEEEKEGVVCAHSERLAVAFGLVRLGSDATIRVMKSLRICGDCHSAIKMVSRIYAREVVVRDRSRFHRFRDGVCSCNDFW
ncbi:Pentatricopeptide repeat-containing protein [Acorus gramineus]|uniref:Pentatricopeptide repeat-containing protein n=1 Tax=Acorus gramineus TaxID=55184 RepID=A0AAV9AS89_ACOGR|nr:Pentatricopeptide repeat-containing protein [Acorus gramineus]